MEIELLKKTLSEGTEGQLNDAISKGALKLDDKQIKMVSFVFWICYMAEIDLTDCMVRAWNMSTAISPPDEATKDFIKVNYSINLDKINESYMREEAVFNEKIVIYEKLFGETEYLKIIKKIKKLRNDISHNRIDELSYNGKSLLDRKVKEEMIVNFFKHSLDTDKSKSPIWSLLSSEDKVEIEEKVDKYFKFK